MTRHSVLVVRSESVRTLIAVASAKNMMIHRMDVTTAFLNGKLEEVIYMRQPEGFEERGKEHFVCRLRKSPYGLKQSPHCWNPALHGHLADVGFKQSVHDPCIYTRDDAILAVHVDDIIVATDGVQKMKRVKRDITGPFDVKDLGELKHCVGVTMDQGQDGTWIGQPTYTRNVLEKYNMTGFQGSGNPCRRKSEAD